MYPISRRLHNIREKKKVAREAATQKAIDEGLALPSSTSSSSSDDEGETEISQSKRKLLKKFNYEIMITKIKGIYDRFLSRQKEISTSKKEQREDRQINKSALQQEKEHSKRKSNLKQPNKKDKRSRKSN